jgi:hypothetical protein
VSDGSDGPAVLINEVRWGGQAVEEYIELYNAAESGDAVNLEGWTLTDGEGVYILKGTIAPGGFYLLEYNELATPVMADEVYGDYSPFLELDDKGDRISLLNRWGDPVAIINRQEAAWPAGYAGGHGASMELINQCDNYDPENWRTSVGCDLVPYGTPRTVNSTKLITPFLPDFNASVMEYYILLEWQVESAKDISCYNLYRSSDPLLSPLEGTGTFTRINPFPIPADSTRFTDCAIDSSLTYNYLLGVKGNDGIERFSQPVTVTLKGLEQPKPYSVTMAQNFPNPFNPNTEIRFNIEDLEESGEPIEVSVCVFSPRGHIVRHLYERLTYPGSFSVRWDGRDDKDEEVGSGAYYYQLIVMDRETRQILVRLSRKMVLMR